MRYSKIKEVLDFIKGKRVAIVGNAKSIFGQKNDIDGFDVVIRFNKGFITNKQAQGSRTDILFLACELNLDEKSSFKAVYYINRSSATKCGNLTLDDKERFELKAKIGKQPSSGFMAIDICREAGAKSIDLFGFDFEKTPTFYNPEGYETKHDYKTEESIVRDFEKNGILIIH